LISASVRSTLGRSLLVLVAVLIVTAVLLAVGVIGSSGTPKVAPIRNAMVDAYGDSLLSEIQSQLGFQLGLDGIHLTVDSYGGIALCDKIPAIQDRVNSGQTTLVVIQFSGNAFTPCMAGVKSEASLLAKYQSDLTYIAAWLHERRVPLMVVANPPGLNPTSGPRVIPTTWSVGEIPEGFAPRDPAFNQMYQATVSGFRHRGWDVEYVAADKAVAARNGSWTYVLPCLRFETAAMGCNSQHLITVRAPDTAHFCPIPVTGPDGAPGCAVWASGAWRYAEAVSTAARAQLAAL
jgi:hypothetical protein